LSHSLFDFSGLSLEDVMPNFIQLHPTDHPIDESHIKAPDYDATILFASGALMVILTIAICLASISAGAAPDALASMTVFP
jgi:hypothetical protein